MISPLSEVLWPVLGFIFLLSAILCLVFKRWAFGVGLLIPGLLLLGSWQYNRTHEKTSKMNVLLLNHTLVKENRQHPEKSVFFVSVTALEHGSWQGKLRAADIHLTGQPDIVVVEIGERPFTGNYLKSITSLSSRQ